MNVSRSVAELQREHVVFELECIDRMYLFRGHRGHRFTSTKEASPMTDCFVSAMSKSRFKQENSVTRTRLEARRGRSARKVDGVRI